MPNRARAPLAARCDDTLDNVVIEGARMTYDAKRWAGFYISSDINVTPANPGSKAPRSKNWPTEQSSPDAFSHDDNIVAVLGNASATIDLDAAGAQHFTSFVLPTGWRSGRASKGLSQAYYRTDQPARSAKWSGPDGECLVEFRTGAQASVLPYSKHPSGETVVWLPGFDGSLPPVVSPAFLIRACALIAVGTLLLRHYPQRGSRHAFALAVAGAMLQMGATPDEARTMISCLANAASDEEHHDRVRCVESTVAAIAAGRKVQGLPATIPHEVTKRITKWMNAKSSSDAATHESDIDTASSTLEDIVRDAGVKPLRSDQGRTFMEIPTPTGGAELIAIGTPRCGSALRRIVRAKTGRAPKKARLEELMANLLAEAEVAPAEAISVRFGRRHDEIQVDLGDGASLAVRIRPARTAPSWIVERATMPFERGGTTLALPAPVRRTDVSIWNLRPFINVATNEDFVLLVAWMIDVIVGRGARPLLVLSGEQGSAKSTTTRIIRLLLDPDELDAEAPPRSAHDLQVRARTAALLAFDNLSSPAVWLPDAFCRMATGAAMGTRKLYSDEVLVAFKARVSIILNGIDDLLTRQDLGDRAILIEAPTIPPSARQSETELLRTFDAWRPHLLAALYDAVSLTLGHLDDVRLPHAPRMADFATTGVAMERALKLPEGAFLRAYESNRQIVAGRSLAVDPVAEAVKAVLGSAADGSVTHSPTTLLSALTVVAEARGRLPSGWPTTPRALSDRLKRLAPHLRGDGIEIVHGKSGSRFIQLRDVRHVRADGETPR